MPRFFFHVVNGEFVPDTIGIDCASREVVKEQAVRIAGEMLKDQGLAVWTTGRWYMFVCDEQNRAHLKLAFDAEDLTGDAPNQHGPVLPIRSVPQQRGRRN